MGHRRNERRNIKSLRVNDNDCITLGNLWNTMKVVLRGNSIQWKTKQAQIDSPIRNLKILEE